MTSHFKEKHYISSPVSAEIPTNHLGPVNIIMELCRHGSLIQHLRRINQDSTNVVDPSQLDKWSLQVANGMSFLSDLNVTINLVNNIIFTNLFTKIGLCQLHKYTSLFY